MALSQILDTVHNVLFHTFDLGLRIKSNFKQEKKEEEIDEKKEEKNDESPDDFIDCIENKVFEKKQEMQKRKDFFNRIADPGGSRPLTLHALQGVAARRAYDFSPLPAGGRPSSPRVGPAVRRWRTTFDFWVHDQTPLARVLCLDIDSIRRRGPQRTHRASL